MEQFIQEYQKFEMFNKAITEVSKRFKAGTFEKLKKEYPVLYERITLAEKKLDNLFSTATLHDFREVLKEYYFALLTAIKTIEG